MTDTTDTPAPNWTPTPWPDFKVGIISRFDYERAKACVDLCATVPASAIDDGKAVAVALPAEFISMCRHDHITPEALLRSFVGDLCGIINWASHPRTDGYGSNGSDEREMADAWYRRCGFPWGGHYLRLDKAKRDAVAAQVAAAKTFERVHAALCNMDARPAKSVERREASEDVIDAQFDSESDYYEARTAVEDWIEEARYGKPHDA